MHVTIDSIRKATCHIRSVSASVDPSIGPVVLALAIHHGCCFTTGNTQCLHLAAPVPRITSLPNHTSRPGVVRFGCSSDSSTISGPSAPKPTLPLHAQDAPRFAEHLRNTNRQPGPRSHPRFSAHAACSLLLRCFRDRRRTRRAEHEAVCDATTPDHTPEWISSTVGSCCCICRGF